jgi:hypothetical protein
MSDSMKQIQSLQKEIDACRQVNAFLMVKWQELSTDMNLAEMVGLGKDTGADVAICHIATEFNDLKKEIETLQQYKASYDDLGADMRGLEEENEALKEEKDRLKILHKTHGYQEAVCDFKCDSHASTTLDYIKTETDDKEIIKYVFDMVEEPFAYNIRKDEIFNREDYSSDEVTDSETDSESE